MARSIVGKLLAKIKGSGSKKSTPTPTPEVPKGPSDPDRARLLYTRLRDAGLVATRQQLTLGGQLEARRKEIVVELEADRYDEAERLLDVHDEQLAEEVREQERATQRLKEALPPLRLQVAELAKTSSSSPDVTRLIKAAQESEAAILDQVKAKAVIAAAALLPTLESRIKAVEKQQTKDQEAFDKAQEKLRLAIDGLSAPVIGPELKQIKATWPVQAQDKANTGDHYGALVLALKGVKACEEALALQQAYELALSQAKSTLQTKLGKMFPLDAERIQKELIDPAIKKAAAGERQAALDLLAQVSAQCDLAKGTRDRSPFNSTDTAKVAEEMRKLLAHAQRAALDKEITALNQRYERAKANQSQSLNKASIALFSEIYFECQRLSELADGHGRFVTRRDTVVQPLVKALRDDGPEATVTALDGEIKAVEDLLAKAGRQAGKHFYEVAGGTLDQVQEACTRVVQRKQDHVRYAALRKTVADLLDGLPNLSGTPLEATAKGLSSRLTQATDLGDTKHDFVAAIQALAAIEPEAEAARQWVLQQDQAKQARSEALPTGTSAEAVTTSLDKTAQLLEALQRHAGQAGAQAQIKAMTTLLEQARKALSQGGDGVTEAGALATQAADQYVLGIQHAEQHARVEARIKDPVGTARALLDDKHPALAQMIKSIDEQIETARKLSVAQDHVGAHERLDAVTARLEEAKRLVKDSESCVSRLAALKDTDVPALTTHSPADKDPVIGAEIKALTQALAQIDRLIKSQDYAAALTALDQAETRCQRAAIRKKVSAGTLSASQMTDACKRLAARPGGQAALDELVGDLQKGQSVDAVLAALKARFKLDDAECIQGSTEDSARVTQELCALYTSMTKVPDKHTRDNPSFKKIVRKQKSGSSYSGGSKSINMGEGHPDSSSERVIAIPSELPDTDEDCKPDPKAKPTKFFDWNTWHEVGHALDDRKQFMAKNGSKAEYGGWIKHGGDLLAVATAVADELALPGITAKMIATYLDSKTEPSPKPTGWAKVTAWALAASSAKIPWKAGAKCGTSVTAGGLQAGGRIYHEGYDGDWYSYLPAARKQGITGYQFRAPGEWFSELYAAYKSDKLKTSHPAKVWLDKLFAD